MSSQDQRGLVEAEDKWLELERTRLECRTINRDQKGLVEAGDEQSDSKGHGWSVG